ncbi:MAG: Gfo/Idh/MocA family oxidoreductase [Planctomycetota bacterium]|nr:Gfo/Idh/MocA family oxidoreductase [Planctomycetota bacterium]
MLKLGILDFDTSHVVQFSKRLNKRGIEQEQWVDGAEITHGWPGTSKIMPERIPPHAKTLAEECGVKLVDRLEDLLGKVDGVLIESNDGSIHLERARPFLEAGIPVFIDKPFALSLKDAEAIVELAQKKNLPVFSSSSLRYAPEVQDIVARREELGAPVAVHALGPQSGGYTAGWFFYAIHAVETLFALTGPGHGEIQYRKGAQAEHAATTFKNGALGAVTVSTKGGHPYGFTYVGEKQTVTAKLGTQHIYRELLKRIVGMFQTGKSPLPVEETLGIVRYLEDVNRAGAGSVQ